MRCIVVDDEPLALELMRNYISKVPFLELIATCGSAAEALVALKNNKTDLLFLDIQMPDITGVQLLKSLKEKPIVIFTTAYEEYALEGFNLDAIDYLLKPIPFDRFLKAVNKAQEYHSIRQNNSIPPTFPEINEGFLFVKADYKIVKISIADIQFVEGLKDYIKIFTSASQKPILTLLSLKSIEEKLPARDFVRVHRSFIVSIPRINSIQRNRIFIGEKEIPVGEQYKEAFFSKIKLPDL